MEKKNYNIEIFFEAQKKSFVILSKNKITLEEIKSRTIREFNIPPEYEKDIRFSITINNRAITISNDYQIMKNFEEMSKNNFYLKINLVINNNNYIFQPSSSKQRNNKNKKQKMEKAEEFSIISKIKIKSGDNRYIQEINKLKVEIEKLKNERNNKPEFDIRKFDEKYRDLSNKNNDLEQKIIELEKENKTLKTNQTKKILEKENYDNINNNDILFQRIEKYFTKLIEEHDKKICKELYEIKKDLNAIKKGKNVFDEKNKINKIEKNDNFELLNDDNEIEKSLSIKKEEEKNNNINTIIDVFNEIELDDKKDIKTINKKDNSNIKLNIYENKSDNLKNIEDIIIDNKTENKIIKIDSIDSNKEKQKQDNTYLIPGIKRNINFYAEDENEKNSKSFDNSSKIKSKMKLTKNEKSVFNNIKDKFLENNNNPIKKYFFEKTGQNSLEKYTKYIIPNKPKDPDKIRIKNKRQAILYSSCNNNNINNKRPSSLSEEDLINYESNSEFNSDIKNKKLQKRTNSNLLLKKEKIRNINKINNHNLNITTETPSPGMYITDKKKYGQLKRNDKSAIYTTPNIKEYNIKESIDNYFINVFQSIFFYGNNGYVNMLNISDKLTKKIKDGLITYRNNMKEVKDSTLKYISYSIIPIINDINTKEYQRKILKEKIKIILEYMSIDINYFENEYKNNKENKSDKKSADRNINTSYS